MALGLRDDVLNVFTPFHTCQGPPVDSRGFLVVKPKSPQIHYQRTSLAFSCQRGTTFGRNLFASTEGLHEFYCDNGALAIEQGEQYLANNAVVCTNGQLGGIESGKIFQVVRLHLISKRCYTHREWRQRGRYAGEEILYPGLDPERLHVFLIGTLFTVG